MDQFVMTLHEQQEKTLLHIGQWTQGHVQS